ncbi:flagellar motor protein MotB [Konateibacter massiliensis]|uniref:flagellar motor protein MotB n=1 Tax=Konateibacter massiliensis TaxID=2002841 RepID=UPI000C150C05|nr:flagellar motor protein MotB [Konateibacter massiliensis]
MAKKKKKQHHEEENGEAWLLPYSDLMTLLLAVFIVLFAVSKVDQAKSSEMAEAFRSTMTTAGFEGSGVFENNGTSPLPLYPDGSDGEQTLTEGGNSDTENQNEGEGTGLGQSELDNLEEVQTTLDTMFEEDGVSTSVSTYIDDRGLIISLDNAILFDSGSAEIKLANEDTLLQIANTINALDNYIRIEGHTDNIPISNSIYPSNWELSSARAASVVKLFIAKCDINPEKLVAVGYGEYRPISDNSTAEGRAQNRRIDIIILSEKYNSLENQLNGSSTAQ